MPEDRINKILVIRLSSLGDILLSTPVIRALKKKYANSIFHFAVNKQYVDTLRYNPNISKLYLYEKEKPNEIINELKINDYDLVVDLQNNFRSRQLTRSSNKKIIRFKKPTFKKLLIVWLKINRLKNYKTITQRYAESAGIDLDNDGLDLFLPDDIRTNLSKEIEYIGFCPGSKHFTKRWPAEYFIELGKLLSNDGVKIVLFGGREDQNICAQINSQLVNSINLCNDNQLLQTAADMKFCKLMVCNDSGLMHVASAMSVPLISIFGSSVKEFGFVPYKTPNLILENNLLTCRPCSHVGKNACPKKHFKCMQDIIPAFVYKQTQGFLNQL